MKKLSTFSRILVLLSALIMIISFFVPIWQILMWAPQYPEGLEMKIWLHTLSGDYKIISGLNHYIGMKHIEIDMFPEFGYMRYIVGVMIAIGIFAALANRRILLVSYVIIIFAAAGVGLIDFYNWGYDYGHNLDPNAAIIVPGMAYQPPLIGTKQLLNFTAYSGPDIGGYVLLVSGLMCVAALIYDLRTEKKSISAPVAALLLIIFVSSCAPAPEPITFGRDGCHFCKMTIIDKHFGCELVTKKGKVYKFDDVTCLLAFSRTNEVPQGEIAQELIVDFENDGNLIDVRSATLIQSNKINGPMRGNIAAFSDQGRADGHNREWNGAKVNWQQVVASKEIDLNHMHN